MPASASVEAVERSMPRVRITIICASASMARIEVSFSTRTILSIETKVGA